MKEQMNIVIAGHVDHGKSTIIGRLLADTDTLPDGKLEQVKENCLKNSKPFEYAFLLDALKDEQSQGITIDSARVFFKTKKRDYIIIDAPGHIEFLKNMVSGAARAEAALLVIDAEEGVQENSRRHGYMISMLGIKQLAVLVNKMDLVDYKQDVYERIVAEYTQFLHDINIQPKCFIPVSGREGDNLASVSGRMDWYDGVSLLTLLDDFSKEPPDIHKPFRMPVQDVYKFTQMKDSRRIVAGNVDSGSAGVGDEVVFYPSGKKSKIRTIEYFSGDKREKISVNESVGFTLDEQLYISRGEVACLSTEKKPKVARRIKVNIFWLGRQAMKKQKDYYLKIGTAKIRMQLEEIHKIVNASDLGYSGTGNEVKRHDVAECTLRLNKAIAFDLTQDAATTSRFVIVDEYEIAGGGIINEDLDDKFSKIRDWVMLRNYKWEKSMISAEQRAEKFNQKSTMIILTGERNAGKKSIAKQLESQLFSDGKIVYFLGIGNVLYGVDADIKEDDKNRDEHMRRLAEVVHIMLDAGVILIVTAIGLTQYDLELIKTTVNPDKIETVWVGENITTDVQYDVRVPGISDIEESVHKIKNILQEKGIIFKPW